MKNIISFFEVLNFSLEASERYCRIIASEGLKGSSIGDFDAMIAGIALTNGESVVTTNLKHFEKVEGLQVETW